MAGSVYVEHRHASGQTALVVGLQTVFSFRPSPFLSLTVSLRDPNGTEPVAETMSSGSGHAPLLGESDYNRVGMGTVNLFVFYTMLYNLAMIFGVIGACVALFLLKHEESLQKVREVAAGSFGPLYIGIYVLHMCITNMTANLGTARRAVKVNVPDQHVYKVVTGTGQGSIVLMDDEEAYGRFNRSQRALQNFYEAFGLFILQYVFAGYVFPYTAAACAIVFGLLRLKSALDYTRERTERRTFGLLGNFFSGSLGGIVVTVGVYATYLELW